MNHFFSQKFFRLFLLLIIGLSTQTSIAQSCSNSSLTLNGVTVLGGGLFELDVRLCIGGGILGINQGAGNRTNSFAFSFSGTGIVLSSFPMTVTSDTTGCLFNGALAGPQPGLNADQTAFYTPASGCDYSCISSTALCGRPHSDCKDYLFTVNLLPDSIRVYGIEGAGNPFAGCLNLPTMLIDFTTALDVAWGSIISEQTAEGLKLQWQTLREENNAFFIVERSADLQTWEDRGQIRSLGSSELPQLYSFLDAPSSERVYYRVRQVDHDGQYSYSSLIAVSPQKNELKVFPNPADDILSIQGLPKGSQQINLYNQVGQVVLQESITDQGRPEIKVDDLPSGIYLLRIQHSLGQWQERVIIE